MEYVTVSELTSGPIAITAYDGGQASSAMLTPEQAAELCAEILHALSPQLRLTAFENFCSACGTNDPRCQCWNDD